MKVEEWLDRSSNTGALAVLLVTAAIIVCAVLVIAVSLLVFTVLLNVIVLDSSNSINPFTLLGSFGDFIGGTLNPLLTFLMFMGVLVTIVIQSIELRQTREEIRNQAKSNKEHVEIIKREESRRQLTEAFVESRDQFWKLSKEGISGSPSIYDLVLSGRSLPEEKHYEMQLRYINRKLETLSAITTELLRSIKKEIRKPLISDVEDIFTFAVEAKIASEEEVKEKIESLEKVISSGGVPSGQFVRIWRALFGEEQRKNEKT